MKVESINIQFELQKIHNQFGTTEMANYKIQQLCEKYAKDQIKKDRKRVEKNTIYTDGSTDIEATHNNKPIILD